MIYQQENKRTAMLSLAISHIAYPINATSWLRCHFLCHVLKALFFNKIALKLSYSCKKCKIFERWGLCPQTPVPPVAGGKAPRPPNCEFLSARLSLPDMKPTCISSSFTTFRSLLSTILLITFIPHYSFTLL